jgi:hypothetical protein
MDDSSWYMGRNERLLRRDRNDKRIPINQDSLNKHPRLPDEPYYQNGYL